MRNRLLGSICLFLGLSLAACGGGGGSSGTTSSTPSSTSSTISTNVVKGIIQHGKIVASRWENGSYVEVGSTYTDSSGNFSLTLSDTSAGVLKIDLALADDGTPTTMICDAASCGVSPNTVSFGQTFTLSSNPGLSTWATIDGSGVVTVMPMSPVSTFVVDYADAVGGNLNANTLQLAENRVALVLGLELADLLTKPGNLTSSVYTAAASAASMKLSLLAAAFAQLANAQSVDIATVITNYVNAFVSNNGRLLQDDPSQPSVKGLLSGALNVANTAGIGSGSNVSQDFQTMISSAVSGQLSSVPSASFDSAAFLANLGPLGSLINTEIQAEGVASLQQLLLGQLSQFGWVVSSDTKALLDIAGPVLVNVVYASALCSFVSTSSTYLAGSDSSAPGDLVVLLDFSHKTLTFNGTGQGVTFNNLVFNLTALNAGSHAHPFVFSASGSVTSGGETFSINGSLTIDPQTTSLTALNSAAASYVQALIQTGSPTSTAAVSAMLSIETAVATILQTGNGTFTVSGSAGLAKGDSTLGVGGNASLTVDMAGGSNGSITASGSAEGTLTLPNGMSFSSDPATASGNHLTFSLAQDGSFDTQFTALNFLKLPNTQVTASGTLTSLGTLLGSVRDSVVSGLGTGVIDLTSIFNTVLGFDYSSMHLTLNGSAVIPAPISETYGMTIAGGVLTINQPGGVDTITLTGNSSGLLFQAGTMAWQIGLDLSNEADPVFVFTDPTTGGSSSIDLNSVLSI